MPFLRRSPPVEGPAPDPEGAARSSAEPVAEGAGEGSRPPAEETAQGAGQEAVAPEAVAQETATQETASEFSSDPDPGTPLAESLRPPDPDSY